MRDTEGGFTLIEVLIALVLFSLIGIAGFSLLNAIVGVQSRTDQRLDRLADLQRAMYVMALDFQQQVATSPISIETGAAVLSRYGESDGGRIVVVRYDLDGGNLRRTLARPSGGGDQAQILLSGVESLRWQFFGDGAGWVETWPPAGADADVGPEAIAVDLTIAPESGGLSGILRRVIRLPARAEP